jgi:hypothetical protein
MSARLGLSKAFRFSGLHGTVCVCVSEVCGACCQPHAVIGSGSFP